MSLILSRITIKQNQCVENLLRFMVSLCHETPQTFTFILGKRHNVFLHNQASWSDYGETIPHLLRHIKVDVTLVLLLALSSITSVSIRSDKSPLIPLIRNKIRNNYNGSDNFESSDVLTFTY